MFCSFVKKIDLYGKEPEFYFKGSRNKTTWVGRILTYLYVIIYIAFLIYKLDRMIRRVDVTFYDTYAYTGEIPSIQLSKETFYGAFAFQIPGTETCYADEMVYTIDAKFVSQVKNQSTGEWIVNQTHIPMKHCELSDFGSKYQSIVGKRDLSGMWCPTNVDFVLEGYTTLDKYSYIKMNFKPCRNDPEKGIFCYPQEILEQYLYATSIDSIIEDIDLTPQNHDHPVQQLERDVPGPTFMELYQMIYVYMQLVIIETDDNIIGFEALTNTKVQKHLKYETSWIVSRPVLFGRTIFDPVAPAEDLNDITIQLSPNVLTQRRKYVQLIDVLGDVGGLMEIINMILSVISSLIVDILYEKSLVNNLFNFDLDRKLVILKHKNIKKNIHESHEDNWTIKKTKKGSMGKNDLNLNLEANDDNNNEEFTSKKKALNDDANVKKQKRKSNINKEEYNSQSNVAIYKSKNNSSKRNIYDNNEDISNKNYLNDMNAVEEKIEEKDKQENIENMKYEKHEDRKEEGSNIIKKIKVNKFYVHCGFCCARSISTLNNTLLDEGMKLIVEQLDIFNVFRKLYTETKREEQLKEKAIKVEMSDECKKNLVEKLMEMNKSSSSISG